MEWISVSKKKPTCWETGQWDGTRSDLIFCRTVSGSYHVARVYEGMLDGTEFFEWYDGVDFEIEEEVTHWFLPEPPKQ